MVTNMSDRHHVIVVVDDEPDIVAAIRRAIRNPNYTLKPTTDSNQALEWLKSEKIDLLMSDVDMPQMNGHELMREALRISPGTVRILVTGANTQEAAVKAINEGEVHRYVSKPFDAPALRTLIADALARQDELALASAATGLSERRKLLYEQLESEYPGITKWARDEAGDYVVDVQRAQQAAGGLGLEPFLSS